MLSLLTALQDALMKICVKEEGSYGTDECPRGEGPLWSATTLHQTHIFIFILACTHGSYVAVSAYVCSWKLRQWRRWEAEGEGEGEDGRQGRMWIRDSGRDCANCRWVGRGC